MKDSKDSFFTFMNCWADFVSHTVCSQGLAARFSDVFSVPLSLRGCFCLFGALMRLDQRALRQETLNIQISSPRGEAFAGFSSGKKHEKGSSLSHEPPSFLHDVRTILDRSQHRFDPRLPRLHV